MATYRISRAIVLGALRNIFVTDTLIADLDLKQRFPDLRLEECPVVDEPLDGETLPGDPEWDGVLRRKYPAQLGLVISVAGTPKPAEERAIYREFQQRLNRELAAIGVDPVSRDRGSHGSCGFHARGFDATSLKDAVLRALSGWRVKATFNMTLSEVNREGFTLDERTQSIYIWGDPEALPSYWPAGRSAVLVDWDWLASAPDETEPPASSDEWA
jgi:hypothetical protein